MMTTGAGLQASLPVRDTDMLTRPLAVKLLPTERTAKSL